MSRALHRASPLCHANNNEKKKRKKEKKIHISTIIHCSVLPPTECKACCSRLSLSALSQISFMPLLLVASGSSPISFATWASTRLSSAVHQSRYAIISSFVQSRDPV
ncbi:hypothetical protein FPOAC2_13270 [Fusarium poae]